MTHIFRNNTVEPFFARGCSFSGYDDISRVPEGADLYVWWYQLPVGFEAARVADEVRAYIGKFRYVLGQIDASRTVVALTMHIIYNVPLTADSRAVREAVDDYNRALAEACPAHANLKVLDLGDFLGRYPREELLDWKFYFLSQMGLNPKLAREFKAWWARQMDGVALRRKKCLVLDCDNTLWGGILGEDGVEGIQIGGDYPGKAFLYFQEALAALSRSGVILCVCSKNNEADVLEAWARNPFMVLRREAFAAVRINWTDKATNLRALAAELNIGLDSMVFVDDNPSERALVSQELPMVSVPEFPAQPYRLPAFFEQLVRKYFRVYTVTDEDRQKTLQYRANASRAEAQRAFTDLDGFLASLQLHITIARADAFNLPRIAQMTQKTNQFNLTTRRYTDADLRGHLAEGWRVWCVSVADRFGDSGITGALMLHGEEIDTLLMSCRILGKGIETAFTRTLFAQLRREGMTRLTATYVPTAKNAQVSDLYTRLGFTLTREEDDGTRRYALDLREADLTVKDYYHITVK